MGDVDWAQDRSNTLAQAMKRPEAFDQIMAPPPQSSDVTNVIGHAVTMPANWTRNDYQDGSRRLTISFKSPDNTTEMTLFNRGVPLSAAGSQAYNDALQKAESGKLPQVLQPSTIKTLAEVMGRSTVGDNQYVNAIKPPDPQAPAFHMLSAQFVSINGKTVLEVQGNFVTDSGAKGKEYKGIFVPGGTNGNTVQEMFVQSDNLANFTNHQRDYKNTINSIRW